MCVCVCVGAFNTNNTIPIINIPIVNVPIVNIPIVNIPIANIPIVNIPIVNIPTVDVPTVKTQTNNMWETPKDKQKIHILGTPFAQARWRIKCVQNDKSDI